MQLQSDSKIVLCRPQSGLNDFLCEIERCCRYAEVTGRFVIVDAEYKYGKTFQDKFSNYFLSKFSNLILDAGDYITQLNDLEVVPHFLQGRVNSYRPITVRVTSRQTGKSKFVAIDQELKKPLTFDFSRQYQEQLLVHQQTQGGELSLFSLLRMGLHHNLVDMLVERLQQMAGPYLAVHIRHTDHKTRYHDVIEDIKKLSFEKLFLATDSVEVKDYFIKIFSERLVSFTDLEHGDTRPLHVMVNRNNVDRYKINRDAILDLLTLAFAEKLVIAKITKGSYSGFSKLAYNLNTNRTILRHLISRNDPFMDKWFGGF